ncbi:pentapeptide repeat-containing protein [Corallococcus coralloides DSM 2259]|uniref:Pentapeptide repeat-containing protein n=2 Tax=Corallococcus coralloides TaxID=184914 RepID=H8MJV0_CORCM|nr:pentapeptide repeat-containing protein [Corallococcus coralloides DSM 2259]
MTAGRYKAAMAQDDSAVVKRLQQEDSFERETFEGLDLQNVDLGDKEFYRCTFVNCELQESRWKEALLEVCVFQGCNLTRANFNAIRLRDVRFEGSKLMGIDWTGVAANPEVNFEECSMPYSSFVGLGLRQASFVRCVAREANFFDMDLTDADFTGADLTGSNFRGCTLTRTDFSGATGLVLDPARNKLKETRIPQDTAMSVVHELGMRVEGYHAKSGGRGGAKKTGAKR